MLFSHPILDNLMHFECMSLYVEYGLVAKTFCQLHASNTYHPWCVGEYAKTSSMCVVPFCETCISKELRKDA